MTEHERARAIISLLLSIMIILFILIVTSCKPQVPVTTTHYEYIMLFDRNEMGGNVKHATEWVFADDTIHYSLGGDHEVVYVVDKVGHNRYTHLYRAHVISKSGLETPVQILQGTGYTEVRRPIKISRSKISFVPHQLFFRETKSE